ncbi:hypothetical protein NTE19_003313 [Vibrio fluvialis]|nr:hypothetical protein [Vibrio fluvialis]
MREVPGTLADLKALHCAGLLGELVAIEVKDNQFSVVGINTETETAVVLFNTQLTEKRIWTGSRYIVDVARKLGVDGITFRIRKQPINPPPAQAVKLSSGVVISH